MGELDRYRAIIRELLTEYNAIRYANGDIRNETVFDSAADRYLVVSHGWNPYRTHGVLIHLDIIDGKIWVQRDGTEEGIAVRLVEAGIPKNRIVLAFHPPSVRPHTEFAVA
jgi:hypothetical protein